ncbi:EamA family transporter RarD [Silvimonas sp. JCM 19000]
MQSGVAFAALAYLLWGLLPLYLKALQGVSPAEVLMCRIAWSLVFLGIVLALRKQWSWLKPALAQPGLMPRIACTALFLSANWFIYIWAVANNRVIDASLGYFITPLVNVLLGVLVLRERLRAGQWLAVAIAAAGVFWLTWQAGTLPWISLGLACTFGIYGLLRKTNPVGALEGLTLETLVLFPFALIWLAVLAVQGHSMMLNAPLSLQALLVLAGPVTAIPLLLFALGAKRIPLSTLGLLQYLAPTVQFILGTLLWHEPFDEQRFFGFAIIWIALAVYTFDNLRQAQRNRAATA